MTKHIQSALFSTRHDAAVAVNKLRTVGINEDEISIVAHKDGDKIELDGAGNKVTDAAQDIAGKAALGAGAGALLGVAALAIPGVGPFVAAGAIAQTAIGGAAVAGTAVGAAGGSLAGALTNHGIPKEDADYYADQLDRGGVLVAFETDQSNDNYPLASNVLRDAGGFTSARPRPA